MPTYIGLVKFTAQGISNIKGSPARIDTAKEVYKSFGAELKALYVTLMGVHRLAESIRGAVGRATGGSALCVAGRGALGLDRAPAGW